MHGYAVHFVSGLGIGALGTLIGAGGGWMIVPLLLFGYRFSPQEAVGTSLAVVFLNALSGSIAYMVQGRVLYRMGLAFAAATIPGALVGALLVQYLDSRWHFSPVGCSCRARCRCQGRDAGRAVPWSPETGR